MNATNTSPPDFAEAASSGKPTPLHKWRGGSTEGTHFKYFILWGGFLFIFLMALNMTLFSFVFAPGENFFFNLAAAIVVSWTLILTLYYIWAIYFYNINRGLPTLSYGRRGQLSCGCRCRSALAQALGRGKKIQTLERETMIHPDRNPNSDETLGLPPGTVRGTLALSVLVVAMAMMIASLAMPASMKENEVMIDHFEFLKTGFVMVIAFYFGTKSLEILRDRKGASAKTAHSPTSHDAAPVGDAAYVAGHQLPVSGEEKP